MTWTGWDMTHIVHGFVWDLEETFLFDPEPDYGILELGKGRLDILLMGSVFFAMGTLFSPWSFVHSFPWDLDMALPGRCI